MTPLDEVKSLLATATTEVQYRTVASRAYFAAFNAAIAFAARRGFTPDQTGEDHKHLIEFFKHEKLDLLRRLGHHRLPRLRALRNRADYKLSIAFTQGMAEEAMQDAEEVISWLQRLTSSPASDGI
jgi:uncharacterized protein (UPF0332 family)